MEWHHIEKNTIEEYDTGYQIELIVGTWLQPTQIKPYAPENFNAVQQARFLRFGLTYARKNEYHRNNYSINNTN